MNKLKPCRFCGAKRGELKRSQRGWCNVTCHTCRSSGPEAATQEEAIEKWNAEDPRRRFACKHWDNSTPPEEFCLLHCHACNGPCPDWESNR